ncbi:MAG: DNA mismatch repair endonuclease MutL [Cyanobacteria bacterium P01_D01_bin.105]
MDEIAINRSRGAAASIQPLSQEIVSLMAAGEVIDSLAAVVRELVENSLDAGATRIAIGLWPEQWRVRVADNGMGMALNDMQQAAIAHATSKISTRPDLLNVCSLGFRGEALHSIAQLAQLEVCSRPAERATAASQGYQVSYGAEGECTQVKEVAIAPGTIVTAHNLFHSWQARRHVPTLAQQTKAVSQLIQQIALCHPSVTWQIEKNDAPWLTLWPGPTAKTLMPQMLRNVSTSDIAELDTQELYLAVGLPDRCHRRRPDWVKVAINGRSVDVSELSYAVMNSFRRTLPRDRYPVCFVHLTLSPSQLDWNRHPAKSEIYVQGVEAVCDRLTAAITDLMQLGNLSETVQTERAATLIKAAEEAGEYTISRQIQPEPIINLSDALPSDALPTESLAEITDFGLASLTVLAQVHDTYILAEHSNGLCLIEQHIAHERVLYEQLQQRWRIVPLDAPITLSDLTATQIEQLTDIGIEPEPFGENLWAIRALPEPLKNREDRIDAVKELSQGANLEAALVATACRTAIRNGTSLSMDEMQTLVNQWQKTKRSRTCPHGRPICLTLKETSLARYFRRSWVIGKSHGI